MKTFQSWLGIVLAAIVLFGAHSASAQLKVGYIDSQKILEKYKEAQDAQRQLQDLNRRWEDEARKMEKELQSKLEELESQALLLSEERKKEKQTELQNLNIRLQQFQQDKWGNQGEVFTKRAELMQPVIDKINAVIKKVGSEEKFDYIFDVVNGNILHVSDSQPNLTEKVLEELNKGVATTKPASSTATKPPAATPKPKN
ncbi:MAG: OmpH family outer membrane protein [candidate division KSB1 bacterium]|nr:OmpH family outer membrane protein [candidate division KSB1 bacterium]MDZ7367106.1 OmpH family outer membrane protein [candidate division KSB1 bacterium]MDZ7405084.1 OmpH family outer membrane protein [candidate division KSB1 bacterium]